MKTILTLLFALCLAQASAQINGYVIDEKQRALPGAVVKPDQGKPTLTNTQGYFSFNRPAGYLIISYTGYRIDTVHALKPGMTVQLIPDRKTLKEVLIKSRMPILTQAADRTIINVNDQVRRLADNALEIINLAPGLVVSDQEDAITMNGKSGVQIMINGKIVQMTPRDLAKFLKSMPVGSVKAVEVMSNPPAKYDVNGNTGIINVRTNEVLQGFTGSVDASTSQSTYNWTDLSNMLNYGAERFAVSSYLAWHSGAYLTRDNIDRQLTNGLLQQHNEHLDRWSDPVFRVTAEYQLSKNSTLGGIIEREASTNTGSYTNFSTIGNNAYTTSGRSPNVRHWDTYNLNYRYGEDLSADLDRAVYHKDNTNTVLTSGTPELIYQNLTGITINTFKVDYSHTYDSKIKLEAGLKLSDVKTHQDQNGDGYAYNEKVNALYTSLGGHQGKWAWQVGLRAEQTHARGVADPAAGAELIRPDSAYFNLLPSFYLNYAPADKHNLRFSLSRRIKRPDYSDLAPFTYQVDPLNYQTGNPALHAQRNDQAELAYTFDNRISFTAAYTRKLDYFNPVISQNGNILMQSTGNTGEMSGWNIDLNYPVKLNKWWNMINKLNVADDHFRGQLFQGYLDQGMWRWSASTSQRFNLPDKILLQINFRYNSAAQELIYYQQNSGNISVSASRKFFADKAAIRLGLSDLFLMQRSNTLVNFGSLVYQDYGTFESRRISLSFSWRFGDQKIRQTAERDRGDKDEKNRSH